VIDAALIALENLAQLDRLGFLLAGCLMGLALGAIPGLGGLVGLAILLPFTFDMDAYQAFAIMIGLISVTTTSDTVPAVLFGVPGTVAAQATILDGHPMAKRGEAGRALGAAYTASMLGGVFGALVLALSVPIMRPVVLSFGSPEFLMLGLLGISMVAVLSGRAPIPGLIAGGIGLSVGMVGMDPQTGSLRWVFGQLYLWDGLPLVPAVLGLFAMPEIFDLAIKRTAISDLPTDRVKGVAAGIRDTVRHWFLVLRCSALGAFVGMIPGLGAPVVDWFAYGHAAQSERGARDSFGTGDIRGVLAPEAANNAKEGGALIPTLAFGVPGSLSMALVLSALTIQGLIPGPAMLTSNLHITYTMVWSLAIANIFGAGVCLLLSGQIARLASVRAGLLVPCVIALIFLAAFQATRAWGDLWALLIFAGAGWAMKRLRWPRPPLVLGMVLSEPIETNLFISVNRYGLEWLTRPMVLVIAVIVVATLYYGWRSGRRPRAGAAARTSEVRR
jgi:TctA family transporter